MSPLVVAVDVGSVRGSLAWCALATEVAPSQEGIDPEGLVQAVVGGLALGQPVALGFECPLSVPVPVADESSWRALGRARPGEGNRSWSAGAGAAVLATGFARCRGCWPGWRPSGPRPASPRAT